MPAIQSYEARTKTFAQATSYKVRRLLELGLISRITDGVYQALPIPGYNITTYTIKEQFGRLVCNCQAGRKGRECSHVRAVRVYQGQTESEKERQLHLL